MERYPHQLKEIIEDIRNFIEKEKESDTIVSGYVKSINPANKEADIELQKKTNIKKGSLILIENFIATAIDSYGNNIKVEFKKDPSRLLEKKVIIDTSRNNIILKWLENTIKKIEDGTLNEYNRKFLYFLVKKGKPEYNYEEPYYSSYLNTSQKGSVERSLAAKDFHLIMGPPGTGKTFVINELIKESFKNNENILITAGTNVGVDNILERIEDINENLILRVGAIQSISPTITNYSLQQRREKHPLWGEVLKHEKTIKKAYDDLKQENKELKQMWDNISQLKKDRDRIDLKLEELINTRTRFQSQTDEFKPHPIKKSVELKVKEKEISKKEESAKKYYNLAYEILEFKQMEEDLPDGDEWYKLESEIEELNQKKSLKKISSIFNSKKYQEYIDELNQKETLYNKITDGYNDYWNIRDKAEKEYETLYPRTDGKPDEDALNIELEIIKTCDEYLDLKKEEITDKMEYNKDKLIYESYNHNLNAMEDNVNIYRQEIKNLNTQMHLMITKKDKKSRFIKNIKETISKHQKDQQDITKVIEEEIVSNSQIIATTVASSAQYLLENEEFDLMIMDEASQVSTYHSLMPLLKCKKFILVGDHKQLQPIPEEKLKKDLNISIYNRLIELYPEDYSFLDTQYRMNQEIADISSELFYDGKLKTYPFAKDQTLDINLKSDLNQLINPNTPLTYIDTAGMDYYEEGIGSGCENIAEAELTVRIVQTLLKELEPSQIGVITPYVKQKRRITDQLDNLEVEVETVHRFQGREKDVIIMNFCKSKIGRFSAKFIGEPSQINVAITRAKKKLIIIGNSRSIKQSKLIKQLLELIGEENTVEYKDYRT